MPAASPLMRTRWVRHRVTRAESAETSLGTAGTSACATSASCGARAGRRGIMLVAGAQHRLGDGEIVLAVGDLGIDCQGALVLRYGFRGTVGVEKNLAAVEVDDGKVGVEPFGDGQRLEGFRPLALFGVDLGDLGEDLRSGIEGCRLAEFGEGHLGLMQRVEGESPIVKQIGGGRLQFGGLLEFDYGEIVAALLEVGEGELEVA